MLAFQLTRMKSKVAEDDPILVATRLRGSLPCVRILKWLSILALMVASAVATIHLMDWDDRFYQWQLSRKDKENSLRLDRYQLL